MGFYINPQFPLPHEGELTRDEKIAYNNQKKGWLEEHGVRLDKPPTWDEIPKDCCAVLCIDRGIFQAAGIAYKPAELAYFKEDDDGAPRTWFFIEKKLAVANSDITMEDFR